LDRWSPTTLMTGAAELAPAIWARDFIVFTAGLGDTTNLWKIPIDPRNFSINSRPERLTTGPDRELRPSLTADGRLVFATIEPHLDLWTLALDADRGKVAGNPKQLTRSGPNSKRPSLSADGQKLIFMSSRSGNADIWLRDMRSGKETALTATPWIESHPFLSADGSRFAYGSLETSNPAIYVQTLGKVVGEKLCGDCGPPYGWSADGRSIFLGRGHPSEWKSIDVATGQQTEVIHQGKYTKHMLRQSPDGNWVAFHMPIVAEKGGSPIFIAPLRNGAARPESEWIQVTDGAGMDTTAWWSPNGAILYFLSKRDGAICIWAQHLNPKTKQPVGAPFDVAHFHSARLKVEEVGFGPGVSRDLLVFTLMRSTGNIWSAGTEIRK
jgi:Tol biopolymer transport system component